MGIVEIIVILAVALIVIPPENLPDVMRATGKILRELRLASNMVVRELGGVLDQPSDNRTTAPINPMRPGAGTGANNIAQSAPPTDTTPAAAAVASSAPREAAASAPAEATGTSTAAAQSEAAASSATPAADLKAIV